MTGRAGARADAPVPAAARPSAEAPRVRGFHFVAADGRRERAPRVAGSRVELFCDSATPTRALICGINTLAPGARIPLHYHDREEFQFILSGNGHALDAAGAHYPLGPGAALYCAPGSAAAHGFANTGGEPLAILFAYASPRAAPPSLEWLDAPGVSDAEEV